MSVVELVSQNDIIHLDVTMNNGTSDIIICDYYGVIQGLEDFIAFWKGNNEVPHTLIRKSEIVSIKDIDYITSLN